MFQRKEEGERSSSHTSDDSESAVPVIHRRKQQKAWVKTQGKLQKNKGTWKSTVNLLGLFLDDWLIPEWAL